MIRLSFGIVRTAAILCAVVGSGGCSSDDGPATPRLTLRSLSVTPSPPAKVSVFFTVDNSQGAPVTDLVNGDIEVREDGTRLSAGDSGQRLLKSSSSFRAYTALVLDLSGSIIRNNTLPAMQAAATEFARSLTTGGGEHYVGVFTFDGREKLTMVQAFTNTTSALESAIAAVSTRQCETNTMCTQFTDHSTCVTGSDTGLCIDDSTNLNGAVVEGLTTLQSALDGVPAVPYKIGSLVLFTDGADQAGRVTRDRAVRAAQETPHFVYSLGVGGDADADLLRVVGKSGYTAVAGAGDLTAAFVAVTAEIKEQTGRFYLLEYCSPKRGGRHELTVTATSGDGAVGSFTTTFMADGFTSGCTI